MPTFASIDLRRNTVAAAAMIGTGSAYFEEAGHPDTVAASAGIPFTAWVAFATVLTAALFY